MYLRLYYSTTYHPESNTSTVSVTPRIRSGSSFNISSCRLYNNNNNSNAGVWGNNIRLYTLSSSRGGSNYNLYNSNVSNSFANFTPSVGSISTFDVQHDSSGKATFTLGVLGALYSDYYSDYINNAGGKTSNTITITESAPYSIIYNGNGTSSAPVSNVPITQNIYYGVSYNLSNISPNRSGYTFLGWSTNSAATIAEYQSGQSVTPNGNLTLYAVWQRNSYTLSISEGAGTTVSVTKNDVPLTDGSTILYGDTLSISITVNNGYNLGTHTVNNIDWTTGTLVVSSNVSIVSTATLIEYILSVAISQGVTSSINRTSSPIGNGSIGLISNGEILYYNDALSIGYTIGSAYQLLTATVNNIDISEETLPYNITVNSNVVVSITVKLGAIVYIGNEAYQAFIGDGTNWNQYQAYIGNGTSFDQY